MIDKRWCLTGSGQQMFCILLVIMICFTVIEYKYHIVSKEITVHHSFQAEPCDCTQNTSTAIISAAALTNISLPIITNLSTTNITFSVRTNTSAAIITNASAAIITNASAAIITNASAAIITNTSAVNSPNKVVLKTEEELRNYFVQTPYIFDKFTIVTPTYKRTDNLYRLFDTYCPITDIIHKILILWNNVGESIPEKVIEYAKKCTIPVIFKIMERNNLTSRFIPFTDIETAGILSIDDDLILSNDSIHLAFNTWKKYPYLLVGYTPRSYKQSSGVYKYSFDQKHYTIMLTNVAFIHHKYLELFTHTVPKSIIDYIVETQNGEDITMNVVIGKYLTELGHPMCVGIQVTSGKKDIGNLSKSGYTGLWHRSSHRTQRDKCLNLLADVYHNLYLHECTKTV